ncbi:MAG: helix-turn-helix domain-containing protein [bacterium]
MQILHDINKPTKEEQQAALQSYDALVSALEQIHEINPEIEIEETRKRIRIPLSALKLLVQILKETGKGRPVSIVPVATEVTTQAAAEMLGCSRPHIVKLLETGQIKFTKVGRHRRIKYEDIVAYKKRMETEQESLISQIMDAAEKDGLYDREPSYLSGNSE